MEEIEKLVLKLIDKKIEKRDFVDKSEWGNASTARDEEKELEWELVKKLFLHPTGEVLDCEEISKITKNDFMNSDSITTSSNASKVMREYLDKFFQKVYGTSYDIKPKELKRVVLREMNIRKLLD